MSRDDTLAHFREQAVFCRALGSPFMDRLCQAMTSDIETGGPVARLTEAWPGDPRRDALSLRVAGFLHYSVLTGSAPELAAAYPGASSDWSIETVWPLARDWLETAEAEARAFLASPPQTNETRRAIALLPGFLKAAAMFPGPVHLLELGASAGLNQNWDRFTYRTDGWARAGSSDVLIETVWDGPQPEHLDAVIEIASRAACDQNPIDVHGASAALRLKAYTWPDQPARLSRLDAAMGLARETGAAVDKADAADWLRARLAARPETGLTIIYHSVFLQYPPAETRSALRAMIEEAGEAATPQRPLAWVCFEPGAFFQGPETAGQDSADFMTWVKAWPGGAGQALLRSDGHVTRVVATGSGCAR